MSTRVCLVPAVLLVALLSASARAQAPEFPVGSVAVMPIKAKGKADRDIVEVLDDLLLVAIQEASGVKLKVIGQSDMEAMLGFEKVKDSVGCDDVSCAVGIAGALGVESILSPSVGVLGSKYVLTVVWIKQNDATILKRHSGPLGQSAEEFDTNMRTVVAGLFGLSAAAAPLPAVITTQQVQQSSAPANANWTVRTPKSSYAAGESIVVEWRNLPGNDQDWITVVAKDDDDTSWGDWFYTRGARQGTRTLSAKSPGEYEVRVYHDWPAGGHIVHERAVFTVR